jgi:Tfp pilus assembly protein PilX
MVKPRNLRRRRGATLLMCLFVIFIVSALLMNILQTETLQLSATRNTIEYEQALYWANAGIHQACSNIIATPSWRGTVTEGSVPPSPTPFGFSVTAIDNGTGGVTVTATGYSGRGARTVQANVEL